VVLDMQGRDEYRSVLYDAAIDRVPNPTAIFKVMKTSYNIYTFA
jgi:hypothetical protein